MNDEVIVEKMINYIVQLERDAINQKYASNNNSKKNVVSSILQELERLTLDENN